MTGLNTEFCLGLASLINNLPPEERKRYSEHFRLFKHDLKNNLGMISTAVALMEREGRQNPKKVDWELLGIIKDAVTDSFRLLDKIDCVIELID